ncbi:hypothetical protein FGO68_gene11525 [Halteria grandinella]|uniref:Cytochrome P450 n=1 Tax=Halteria grandinella TaxID=5974 RepID=A0A8J8NQS1_HALGN|nr:hypothetical protein FGO68_gene11525 [Halteria grandinella]
MLDFVERTKYEGNPLIGYNYEAHIKGKATVPPFSTLLIGSDLCLMVNRPEAIEELFITKGKYYDKHPASLHIIGVVAGDSILFARSDMQWQQKRKVISSALYKDRLRGMAETIKKVTLTTIKEDWLKRKDSNGIITLDIGRESANLNMKIVLSCFFGQDFDQIPLVDQVFDGIKTKLPLGEAVHKAFEMANEREFQAHLILFTELQQYYLTQYDRELRENCGAMRNYIQGMIAERRKTAMVDNNDLLSILLKDAAFESDLAIVDECMTFFLAGTVTTATSVSNTLCYLVQQKRLEDKLRDSLGKNFPTFSNKHQTIDELGKEMTLESLELIADDYLKLCFNEALRIDPPVHFSSTGMLTEDVEICGFKIKNGEMMLQNIHQLHHNVDQWGPTHDQYIPERFDPEHASEYPKRHPMSFIPFSGGKRVCIGKTFAEVSYKIIVPMILKAFNQGGRLGEFENKDFYQNLPMNNATQPKRPVLNLILKI